MVLSRFLRGFCVLVTALVLIVSFTPLVPLATGLLATDWHEGDADVLIILGSYMLVPGTGPNATMGYETYLRCVYAWWNIRRFHYRYIIVSGNEGMAEAMAAFLREKGVPANTILLENNAQTTYQNAEFVKNLLRNQANLPPNPRLALLTSDYHSRRASLVFQHAGLPVRVIPVPDLLKQSNSPAARWAGFLTLSEELLKYPLYAVEGKL
jgi:uncharacterized SAM-binding protein YcdF (DUF218 family)